MIINGMYGNDGLKVQDNGVNTVPKEEAENTAAANNIAADTMPALENTDFITYTEDDIQKNTEDNQKSEQTKAEAFAEDKQNNISERMSEEDYKAISEEGISLEKYNAERLARALQRIKTQRAVKEENLSDQKENLNKKTEAIENMANYNAATRKIVQKLIESDLPVTKANITKIATAVEMASSALNLSDKAISYLIKNNLEPTIENIYKARYSGSYSSEKEITDQTFAGLQGQINEIIDYAGLEVNEENIQSAKWLLNNGLPLTDNTLWAYRDLKQLKDNTEEDTVLEKAVEAFMSGKSPETAFLGQAAAERARQAITAFQSISEEAVREVVKNQENGTGQINCRELQKAQKQFDKQNQITSGNKTESEADTYQDEFGAAADNLDIKTITVRRQLEEIRLKMTLDSGQQLIRQGFKLDTDSLNKIVEGLREIEDKYYKNLLNEGSAEVNTENVQVLKNSIQGMEELKDMPGYILGSTLSNRNIITVNGLLTAGGECRNTLNKAGQAYEALMTRPRSDMGDSIAKAFRNVDAILEDMNLETTQANERAVRILGYNGLDITEDNIQYVKSYDEQVNQLMKNFHPAVAVELIKKGTNPLDIPIEKLNRQSEEIQNELGITQEEKYSKYLWKLEQNKSITEDEKKSCIGIYRLLNAVEKTDGEALGAVLKADREVTMQNLLTAVRTMKGGGVDTAVDDSFGFLTQLTYARENITDQLNASFKQSDSADNDSADNKSVPDPLTEKSGYINYLVKDIMDEITPGKLQTLGNTQDLLNMSVEKLKEELLNAAENEEGDKDYWNQKLEEYHEITDRSDNAQRLLKSYDIPSSLSNIQAAKDLLSKDHTFYKQLSRILKSANTGEADGEIMEQPMTELSRVSEDFIGAMTGQASMKEQYHILEQDVNKLLDQMYANPVITSKNIATLQRINYGMSFIRKLAGKESYELPLTVGDNITNVNVTILRNAGESGKVDITVDSPALGKISAGLSVKEQGVKALVICDNRTGLEAIRTKSQELNEAVARSGTEIKQLNYGIGNNMADFYRYTKYKPGSDTKEGYNPEGTEVSTDTLYNLAKTFLVHIKKIENSLQ